MAESSDPTQVPDMGFISTRYGLLRVSQAVIGFLCLVFVESATSCWFKSFHNYNFFASVSSFSMVFAIIVMIFFCFHVQDVIERYINLPLTVSTLVFPDFLLILPIYISLSPSTWTKWRVNCICSTWNTQSKQLCVTETLLCILYAIASVLLIVSYCPSSGLNFLSKIAAVSNCLVSLDLSLIEHRSSDPRNLGILHVWILSKDITRMVHEWFSARPELMGGKICRLTHSGINALQNIHTIRVSLNNTNTFFVCREERVFKRKISV